MWLGFGFSVESFAELGPKPRHFVLAFLFNVNNVTILHANVQSYFDLKCRERSSDGAVRHHKGTVIFTPIITFAVVAVASGWGHVSTWQVLRGDVKELT